MRSIPTIARTFSTASGVALVIVYFSSCGGRSGPPVSPAAADPVPVVQPPAVVEPPPPPPPKMPDVIFSGAGDIADCVLEAESTARILDRLPGSIFTLGDHAYPATPESLAACYEPTWGRHRARTHPSPGNHDWRQSASYFAYFGAAAGPPGAGYYSFDLGTWHILSMNSNISARRGSPQYEWARQDLDAAAKTPCSLAYWHHPLFSSGPRGDNVDMRDLWRLLDDRGVDVVLAGHNHSYERFAPQDADGRGNPRGIREFVVGTGGTDLRTFRTVIANSEVRDDRTWGVLKLTLQEKSYDWEFIPVDGQVFRDAGTADCVDVP